MDSVARVDVLASNAGSRAGVAGVDLIPAGVAGVDLIPAGVAGVDEHLAPQFRQKTASCISRLPHAQLGIIAAFPFLEPLGVIISSRNVSNMSVWIGTSTSPGSCSPVRPGSRCDNSSIVNILSIRSISRSCVNNNWFSVSAVRRKSSAPSAVCRRLTAQRTGVSPSWLEAKTSARCLRSNDAIEGCAPDAAACSAVCPA